MKKIYIKEERCIGCRLCQVYCQLHHSRSKDIIKAFKKELPRPTPRLRLEERGSLSLSVRCQHCDDPPCVYACLGGALSRDVDSGRVTLDPERCIGCWSCLLVCPFGAVIRDVGQKKVAKCDLCFGEEVPACVANCPNEALVYTETKQ